jgi:hypothetical protein
MTDQDLNRALAEKLGITVIGNLDGGLFAAKWPDGSLGFSRWVSADQAWAAFSTDPAISERVLVEECRKRGWTFRVLMSVDNSFVCGIWNAVPVGYGNADTPSRARAMALLEALSK